MGALDLKRQVRADWVKATAAQFGFTDCKIARAQPLEQEARMLEQWLDKGFHGSMDYLERNMDLRVDPAKLVPGAKSMIVLALNYFPEETLSQERYKLSKYAYGRDYHKVIRKRLKRFLEALQEKFGEVNGRGFVDSAPVMEKAWAARAGIGWVGKHTNVLTKSRGSFYFLGVLITDLDIASDDPVTDHCGSCTACIDACPTDAIVAPYLLDARKCISYLTIELKSSELPAQFKDQMEGWMFGCDICQDVCPWNRFSTAHGEPDFKPSESLTGMTDKDWENLQEEKFEELFTGSAVRRTKYEGLMRNIRFIRPSAQ